MINILRSVNGRWRMMRKPLRAIIEQTITKTPPITGAGIEAMSVASLLDKPNKIIQKAQP